MIKITLFPLPEPEKRDQELLQSLLAQAPEQHDHMRPVALLSVEEQRRLAFRSFQRRTWFDRFLSVSERLLIMLILVFFTFWFLNGYGRDWLYAQGLMRENLSETSLDNQSVSEHNTRRSLLPSKTKEITSQQAISLPFTQPGNNRLVADYAAPQTVILAEEPDDQRPHHIVVPALNLDAPVKEVFVEGGVWQVADYAAGYHHGTALPGDGGNTVLAGHAGWRGSVFRHLEDVQIGDDVFLDAGGWKYHYRVSKRERVWPTQVEVMQPTATPILTLITCTEWDTKRLIVVANLVGSRPY